MSTGDIAHQEQSAVPRSRGPAYGEVESPPAPAEPEKETAGPLDRRTEAILAVAIVMSVVATYGAIAYGVYVAADAIL